MLSVSLWTPRPPPRPFRAPRGELWALGVLRERGGEGWGGVWGVLRVWSPVVPTRRRGGAMKEKIKRIRDGSKDIRVEVKTYEWKERHTNIQIINSHVNT